MARKMWICFCLAAVVLALTTMAVDGQKPKKDPRKICRHIAIIGVPVNGYLDRNGVTQYIYDYTESEQLCRNCCGQNEFDDEETGEEHVPGEGTFCICKPKRRLSNWWGFKRKNKSGTSSTTMTEETVET